MKKRIIALAVVLCVGMIEFQYFTKNTFSDMNEVQDRPQKQSVPDEQPPPQKNENCGEAYWPNQLNKEPSDLDLVMDSEYDPNDGHKRAQINGVDEIFVILENGDFVLHKLRMSIILRAMGLSPRFVPKVNHGRAPVLAALDYIIKNDITGMILLDYVDIDMNFTAIINEFTETHPNPNREILWLSKCENGKRMVRGADECGYGFIVNKKGAEKMKDEFVMCRHSYRGKTAVSYPKSLDLSNDLIVVMGPLVIDGEYPTFPNSITKYLYRSFWMADKASDLLMLNV